MHTRTRRSPIGGLLATLLGAGVLLTAPSAQATQTLANTWNTRYPASLSYDNAGCVLCHNTPSGTGGLNPYGIEVFVAGFAGAEPIDSDGDPGECTNLEEINNDTQPAWTPPLPSIINPDWILGLLDPDPSLCGAPNTPPDVTNPGVQRDTENTTQSLQVVASDVDGDTLSYSAIGLPPGLGINASTGLISGTISFTAVSHPDIVFDYNVEVTVSDGTATTPVVFVWTVDDLNRAPLAVNDSDNTPEDTTLDVDVLANDSDADGDALTVTGVTDPPNGTAVNNGSDVTYTPDANFAGTDTFNYTIADGFGGVDTATVTINVTAGNDPPLVTNPGALDGTETDVVSVQIVATDPDGDSLTYSIVAPNVLPPNLTINASTGLITGTVSYDAVLHPALQEVYPVTVAVSDGINPAVPVTFSWFIDDLNRDPVAVDDSDTTVHDTAVTVQVLANDSDADGDALTVVSVSDPANGTAATTDGLTVTYTPNAGFVGSDSFAYTVDDGFGGSATATVTVDVTNEAPVAVNDVYSTPFDTVLTVPAPGVLGNDTDADGDALTAVQQSFPTNGSATLNPDGSFTYTPSVGFTGTDSFVYRASDGIVESAEATVSINVGAVANLCPVVENPGAQTNAETDTVSVQVTASDPDGDVLSYTATGLPPILMIDPSTGEIMNVVSYEAVQHPDLSAVYPVTVSVSDGDCSTEVGFDWTVNDVNRNPVAADDTASTELDTPVTVDVLANDSDADGDALSVASVGAPLNGTAEVNADGTITYTPSTGFTGEDNFVYTIEDGFGGSAQATVTITVNDVTGEADVYLTRINAPRQLMLQVDKEVERRIRVFGDGDTIEQEVKVKLKASEPDGLEVEVEPSKVEGTVVPGGAQTRFDFHAEIECEKQGTYEIVWTAIIDADQNADATNDKVQAVTTVECRKKGKK
jgi:hypothetical protein